MSTITNTSFTVQVLFHVPLLYDNIYNSVAICLVRRLFFFSNSICQIVQSQGPSRLQFQMRFRGTWVFRGVAYGQQFIYLEPQTTTLKFLFVLRMNECPLNIRYSIRSISFPVVSILRFSLLPFSFNTNFFTYSTLTQTVILFFLKYTVSIL